MSALTAGIDILIKALFDIQYPLQRVVFEPLRVLWCAVASREEGRGSNPQMKAEKSKLSDLCSKKTHTVNL